jgi:MFS transporter, CP family, cyanate transporter
LYDIQQSWTAPLYIILGIGLLWMGLGWMASPKPSIKNTRH